MNKTLSLFPNSWASRAPGDGGRRGPLGTEGVSGEKQEGRPPGREGSGSEMCPQAWETRLRPRKQRGGECDQRKTGRQLEIFQGPTFPSKPRHWAATRTAESQVQCVTNHIPTYCSGIQLLPHLATATGQQAVQGEKAVWKRLTAGQRGNFMGKEIVPSGLCIDVPCIRESFRGLIILFIGKASVLRFILC